MRERAARYAKPEKKQGGAVIVAYVTRTSKGKIRLKRIAIRLHGQKEQLVCELPPNDPTYVFEDLYKVRKAAHEEVARSDRYTRFRDSSTRVFYDDEKEMP